MHVSLIPKSMATHWALLEATAMRNDFGEFQKILLSYPDRWKDEDLLQLFLILASNHNDSWISKVKHMAILQQNLFQS